MIGVADGAGVTSLTVERVAEEEAVWDRFFIMSAPNFRCSFLIVCNWSYTIMFSSRIGENKQS